jgi:malic enzyme
MNTNAFKTVMICLVTGVVVAVAGLLVLNVTNALNATDLTNTELSTAAKYCFGAGAVGMGIYSLVTKRQW